MIESYRVFQITKPLKNRMVNSLYSADKLYILILEIVSGMHKGYGCVFAFKRRHQEALRIMIEDFMSMVLGTEFADPAVVHDQLARTLTNIGDTGIAARALSLVDSALWDLAARRMGLPLHRMVGGKRTQIPLYVSGGWLDLSEKELVAAALECVEKGYRAYKFKITGGDNQLHEKRVAAVRRAVGDKIELMVDANQGFSFNEAWDMSQRLADYGISWFEEPFPVYDLETYRALHDITQTRIAAGETLYLKREATPFLRTHAVDVYMPDLARTAGPTEFLRITELAEQEGILISSHWFTEISAHLAARCKLPCCLEYVEDVWDDLFYQRPVIHDGSIFLSELPGTGLMLDEDAAEKYKTVDD